MKSDKSRAKQLRGAIMLMITAFIWGCAFVAQSEGLNYVGALTFNGTRCFFAAALLLLLLPLLDRFGFSHKPSSREQRLRNIKGGVICGVLLFSASTLQQFGLMDTTPGKSGFITALYIIMIPIAGFLIFRRRPSYYVLISVVIALVGMYLLCLGDDMSVSWGDLLTLLCSFCFTAHILVISHYSPTTDGVRVSLVQFTVCGLISLPLMFIFEEPSYTNLLRGWLPLLYSGLFSGGIAYTLQIIAQKDVEHTVASIIMSLESVFAALAGWIILGQNLSLREIVGCAFMFCAILLAQKPDNSHAKPKLRPTQK